MSGQLSGDLVGYMDTGCTGHLFRDTSMLTNRRPAGNVTATGIFGTSHRVDGAGDFKTMGVVHHTTLATSNLISVTQLLDMGCTMSADSETMRMLGPSGREFIAARRGSSGMFEVALKDIRAFPMSMGGDPGPGAPRLTSAEMLRARAARQLHVSAGHIADEALFFFLTKSSGYLHEQKQSQTCRQATRVYGAETFILP